MKAGKTDVEFKKAAPLRAWLSNNLDLNSFFNGDARSLCTDASDAERCVFLPLDDVLPALRQVTATLSTAATGCIR